MAKPVERSHSIRAVVIRLLIRASSSVCSTRMNFFVSSSVSGSIAGAVTSVVDQLVIVSFTQRPSRRLEDRPLKLGLGQAGADELLCQAVGKIHQRPGLELHPESIRPSAT